MQPGDTYKSDPAQGIPHLHVVVIVPPAAAEVLVVNITTYNDEKDDTCIIQTGEHAFVRHKSCISYRNARVVSLAVLQNLINRGHLAVTDPVTKALLDRILAGFAISGDVPREVKGWLGKYQAATSIRVRK